MRETRRVYEWSRRTRTRQEGCSHPLLLRVSMTESNSFSHTHHEYCGACLVIVRRGIDPRIEWCAREVERQGDGPLYVAYMYRALCELQGLSRITPDVISLLGALVHPSTDGRWATVPRMFPNGTSALNPEFIPRQIELFCDNYSGISPLEVYRRFEDIHPFTDGNGRVGALLYNHRAGTLFHPLSPPDIYA